MRVLNLAAAALVVLLSLSRMEAATISYNFTGSVSSLNPTQMGLSNIVGVKSGDPLSGTFSINTATPGSYPDSVSASYPSALTNFNLKIGNVDFAYVPTGDVYLRNNYGYPGSYTDTCELNFQLQAGGQSVHSYVAWIDNTGQMFSTRSLPEVSHLGHSLSNGFYLSFYDLPPAPTGDPQQIIVRMQTLTPVPEPSTLTIFGVGMIGLLAFGWRRRRLNNTASGTV